MCLGLFPLAVFAKPGNNPVVPNGQLTELHGTYPSVGIGDGDWTHVGVDLAAPCGDRVYTFANGLVIDIINSPRDANFGSLGYMVLIEHPASLLGKTFYTLYLHLQEPPTVKKGEEVRGGKTVIGRVGTTGTTTGCHTHFEVRYFSGRFFKEWCDPECNIYGRGDQRDSELLDRGWDDPLGLFAQYPKGVSVALPKEGTGPQVTQEARVTAEATSEPPQTRRAPVTEGKSPETLTAQRPTAKRPASEMEPQSRERSTVAVTTLDKPRPATDSTSVWALGTCTDSKSMLIRNSLGTIIISKDQTIRIQDAKVGLSADVEKRLVRCPDLPGHYYALFGEALALFRAAEGIAHECEAGGDRRCLGAAFGFADVTGDGQLSPAEMARVVRALSFFIGYAIVESQNKKKKGGGPVKMGDVSGFVVLANILSPLLAKSLVESYDFDVSGAVSLDELLQDRGQDQLIGAAGTLGAAAADATIKGIFKILMGALPAMMGLFGSL